MKTKYNAIYTLKQAGWADAELEAMTFVYRDLDKAQTWRDRIRLDIVKRFTGWHSGGKIK